jgi:hypothetical protein
MIKEKLYSLLNLRPKQKDNLDGVIIVLKKSVMERQNILIIDILDIQTPLKGNC